MISCVLLAAGMSERFGSPKALARLGELPVIEHIQKELVESQVGEIIVVLGHSHEKVKSYILKHKKVHLVYNKDYKLGQTSSFQCGLRVVSPDARGFMLMPVDCPCVEAPLINALLTHFEEESPYILIPACGGKKGHPPVFHHSAKDEILALSHDVGLNVFEHRHADRIAIFPVDNPDFLATFNTPAELDAIRRRTDH